MTHGIKSYVMDGEKYVLEINENRIIASNPFIEPHQWNVYHSLDDVQYLYYDLEIQYNEGYYDRTTSEHKTKWVRVAAGKINECIGALLIVPKIIDDIISANPDEGYKQYFIEEDGTKSETDYTSYTEMVCAGMFDQDVYVFRKYHCHQDKALLIDGGDWNNDDDWKDIDDYRYSVSFGVCTLICGNVMGVKTDRLDEEDMLTIKKWASDFLKYAEECTIKEIAERIEEEKAENDNSEDITD